MSAVFDANSPATAAAVSSVSAIAACPYKGLDYFEDSAIDRMVFAGRDGDIREALARIVTQRALVFYGRSGLGKTSLLLAGVFPRLREQGFRPVYVRAAGSPRRNLLEAIRRACDLGPADAEEGLFELLKRVPAGVTPVLVLDQFEEFFIQFREQHRELAKVVHGREELARKRGELALERSDFVDLISTLITDESRDVRVVFSLREDYLAALDDFQRQLPDLFREAYRLLPLTAFGAREAIVQPLRQGRLPYDERLVTRLVNELAEFEFDSARLQITCLELFRLARAHNKDTPKLKEEYLNELIEARGTGLDRVFRRYLAGAVEALTPSRRLLARTLLDALITSEKTKRATSREELMELKPGRGREAEAEAQATLDELCAQKLVRAPAGESNGHYEIIHECLVPEILRWLESDPEFAKFRQARDIIINNCRGEAWRARPELLLSEVQLSKLIRPYRERLRLGETQLEFMARSAIYRGDADAGYWADRCGRAKSYDILLAALLETNDEYRRAAAAAAQQFKDTDGRLFGRCRQLALEDANVEVRRTAGKSLGSLAADEQLKGLKSKLCWYKWTSKRIMELLAGLSEQDRKRAGVPWRWRWPARRIAERRVWEQRRESIENRRSAGTWTGLLAGLAWLLIFVPVFALLFGWIDNPLQPTSNKIPLPSDMDTERAAAVFFCVGPFLCLVSFLGRRAAVSGGRIAALDGEEKWFKSARRMWLPFWCILIALISWFSGYTDSARMPGGLAILVIISWVAVPWAGNLILAGAIQASCDCMREARSTAGRLGWCALTNLEFFVVLPGLLILPLLHLNQNHSDSSWLNHAQATLRGGYIIAVVFASGFHWVMSMSLVQGADTVRVEQASPKGPSRMRRAVLLGAGLSLPWLWWEYGQNAMPQFSKILTDKQGYIGKLSAWPKTSYFHIRSTNRLFRVSLPAGVNAQVSDSARRRLQGSLEQTTSNAIGSDVLFLPSGEGYLTVKTLDPYPPTRILTPLAVSRNRVPVLTNDEFQIVQCDLKWSGLARRWIGEISGRVRAKTQRIELYCNESGATLFHGSNALPADPFTNYTLSFQCSTNVPSNYPVSVEPRWLSFPNGFLADYSVPVSAGPDGTWKVAVSLTAKYLPSRKSPRETPSLKNTTPAASNQSGVGEASPAFLREFHINQEVDQVRQDFRSKPPPAVNEDSISFFVGVALSDSGAETKQNAAAKP